MNDTDSKGGFELDAIDLSSLNLSTMGVKPKTEESPETDSTSLQAAAEAESPDIPGDDTGRPAGDIVERIFQRMKRKGDFPSFNRQIIAVNQVLSTEYASAGDIADVIMRDHSLTSKLVRLVNSSFYGQFGKYSQKGINSVSQAMIILGVDQVQKTAASLMLFEQMKKNSHTAETKDVALGSFISGLMAKDIAGRNGLNPADREEAFICAMFHNLGENIIQFYLPEEYERTKQIMLREEIGRQEASRKVLGVSFKDLGIEIGGKWGLPKSILQSMAAKAPLQDETGPKRRLKQDIIGHIAMFTTELSLIMREKTGRQKDIALQGLLNRFGKSLGIGRENVAALLDRAMENLQKHSAVLNIDLNESRLLRLINGQSEAIETATATDEALRQEMVIDKEREAVIMQGIEDINRLLRGDFKLHDLLTRILDIMYQGFGFGRVIICIKDLENDVMIARYGKGSDISRVRAQFKFRFKKERDLFAQALLQNQDHCIDDIHDPQVWPKIPKWYRQITTVKSIMLYPIVVNNIPMGLFYADNESKERPYSYKHIKYMDTLRNLAVNAIRKKSK